MNELISAIIFVVGMYAGTVTISKVYRTVKAAALEKAHLGTPSLVEFQKSLTK